MKYQFSFVFENVRRKNQHIPAILVTIPSCKSDAFESAPPQF